MSGTCPPPSPPSRPSPAQAIVTAAAVPRISVSAPLHDGARSAPTVDTSLSLSTSTPVHTQISASLTTPTPTSTTASGLGGGLQWSKTRSGAIRSDGSISSKTFKEKSGWGNLPLQVLHLIITHTLSQITPDEVFKRYEDPAVREIVLALFRRARLCDLVFVSPDWRNAVDSHSFWPGYTLIMDPSRYHTSTVDDLHERSLTPSTPSFPTLFHRARHTTLSICLACRINHPNRLGLYPASFKRLTHTNKFGLAPTCEKHYNNYCTGCLIESMPLPDERGFGGKELLCYSDVYDTDEFGEYREECAIVCKDCRSAQITYSISNDLVVCARGTPLRGLEVNWLDFPQVKAYITESRSAAPDVSDRVITIKWLMDQTRWDELYLTALELHRHTRTLQRQWLYYRQPESKQQRRHRFRLEAELHGDEKDENDPVAMHEDEQKWAIEYNVWSKLDETGGLLGSDNDDNVILNDVFCNDLVYACVDDFIRDRVRHGFWVTPSDEVSAFVHRNKTTSGRRRHNYSADHFHTPFRFLALCAQHPFNHLDFDFDPQDAFATLDGIINFEWDDSRTHLLYLPTKSVLESLDECFETCMRDQLLPAMRRLVRSIREAFMDDDKADEYCEHLPMNELFLKLTYKKLWIPMSVMERDAQYRAARANEGVPVRMRDSRVRDYQRHERDVTHDHKTSPKIELIHDDEDDISLPDYGIREEHSTPVTDDEVLVLLQADDNSGEHAETGHLDQEQSPMPDARPSQDWQSSVKRKSLDDRDRTELESADKRYRPSLSPTERGTVTMPTTRGDRVTREGVMGNTDDPSPTLALGKRKAPPSPQSNHIDRTKRQVTPPPPPQFNISPRPSTMIRIPGSKLKPPALSALPSSAPSSPTPAVRTNEDQDLDHDEDMKRTSSGGTEPMSRSESDGSHDPSETTTGTETVLITPEAEEWVQPPSAVSSKGKQRTLENEINSSNIVPLSLANHNTTIGRDGVLFSPLSASHVDADVDGDLPDEYSEYYDDEDSDLSSEEEEEVKESGFETKEDEDVDVDEESYIDRWMRENESKIPFIPIIPYSSDEKLALNLGKEATYLIKKLWFDAREELRRCRCGICERSRRREIEFNMIRNAEIVLGLTR